MDIEWAIEQLNKYLSLHERVPLPAEEMSPNRKTRRRGSDAEVSNIDNVVKAIGEVTYGSAPRYVGVDFVRSLIWELTEGDQVRLKLGIADPAPSIEADSLHPWVWDAARPHWTSGNYDAALWAAGVNVNSRLQRKVGRKDIGEGQLLRESFSTGEPKPGKSRLRLTDPSNQSLFQDLQVGAGNLGQGLYSAVRNVINHVDAREHSFGEAETIEALAAFSLLARWIDRAELVEAPAEVVVEETI
ncbi:TIGR02391 family protein [Cryobacterium sp. 10I5]|uniref:TIGR02391 family protein n=1 Tax=Cryobacterium sp. 10I5 TaxID=3048581 RepID=UPI002B23C3C2|nr:TIGR02391 family protein [Cryobacterium sp. 10I5]MEB0267692.1 TIGR02391 family protein [Cryobacterium sp. 10I5]